MQEHQESVTVGNTMICSGTVAMVIPDGGPIVRQVQVWLPYFAAEPAFTATTCSPESEGAVFLMWDINFQLREAGRTLVTVSAINTLSDPPVKYTIYLSYVAVGLVTDGEQ